MSNAHHVSPAHIGAPHLRAKKRRKRKEEKEEEEGSEMTPGVVYVGHIPHGFYEKEMRSYFSQFGTVTRLRLARSKKVWPSII